MRIKRIAFTGTFLLVLGCLCLYLFLDHTLSTDYRTNNNGPSYALKIAEKSFLIFNHTFRRTSLNMPLDVPELHHCIPSHPSPKVDVQMSDVYDILKFDNIDGGAWKQGWSVSYDEKQWNENKKLKIYVVPHSHNDPGWKKTFEDYYQYQTRSILNNMVKKLREDHRRKFIWAEISFFALWWSDISQEIRDQVKDLINRGQLEFVTGGWVMTDEANSHYYSILEQLTHGHQWLQENLNYTPKHSWAIDPFGLSPTMPYLLKKSGFKALAVQRSHYSVKKYLARKNLLEFRWRQLWDDGGGTELLTHMMPFYGYDVPHTCGPDPKICCQFDFKRLPGFGVTCPWRVPPQPINEQNVAAKAVLILDQYRKKAQLYMTNVLLVPLGDDFRYDHSTEWDNQYINYQKLFDYINKNKHLNAQAQFGTLGDYFNALKEDKQEKQFPSLMGDFFTYADRDDHYWSGYFTSRPFYKRMDRVLMSSLRSAEIIINLAVRKSKKIEDWEFLISKLKDARGSLSLFQHHDGITGTAKDHVVNDYASKMLEAIRISQLIIQQSANFLLSGRKEPQTGEETYFVLDDHQKVPYSLSSQTSLTFPSGITARHVTFFNPLVTPRRELVSLKVENAFLRVKNKNNEVIQHQVSPICQVANWESRCHTLSFIVDIGPFALETYSIEPAEDKHETHVTLRFFNNPWGSQRFADWPEKEVEAEREFSIENNNYSIAFSRLGLLKAVTVKTSDNSITVPIHLSFIRYSARPGQERSGAYLFLPEGEAEQIQIIRPNITIVEGKLMSQVIVQLEHVVHSVILYNTEGSDSHGIEIQNLINIASIHDNYELGMRFSSNVKNGGIFYTDLNGIQIIKRKTLDKIPLQGNYYPLPTSVFIQDDNMRLNILTAQPLGIASLKEGQIEIMQDRKLLQDDNRGLDQGVTDNKPTLNIFRLSVESRPSTCQERNNEKWGRLSFASHQSLYSLLYPMQRLIWVGDPRAPPGSYSPYPSSFSPPPPNLHVVTLHTFDSEKATGATILSSEFDPCFPSINKTHNHVSLNAVIPLYKDEKVFQSTLTFNHIGEEIDISSPLICSIDIVGYYIKH